VKSKMNQNQKKYLIFFIFAILLVTGLLSCQLFPLSKTPTPTPTFVLTSTPKPLGDLGWGSIYGKVIDAATGLPIAGASVTCQHYSYTSPATCNTSTITESDGTYTFPDIFFHDTDHVWLEVKVEGYVTQTVLAEFFTTPGLKTDFMLVAGTGTEFPLIACTAPACGPYESLFCPSGECTGGCGLVCATPAAICTPPLCAIGTSEVYFCAGICPGGCGTTCATFTPAP
jgi:hypothetical protein